MNARKWTVIYEALGTVDMDVLSDNLAIAGFAHTNLEELAEIMLEVAQHTQDSREV